MDTHDVLYVHFKVIFGEVYSGLSLPQVRWMLLCTASPAVCYTWNSVSKFEIKATRHLKTIPDFHFLFLSVLPVGLRRLAPQR